MKLVLLSLVAFALPANVLSTLIARATIYRGPPVTFVKPDFANFYLPENIDCIEGTSVCLTRGDTGLLCNVAAGDVCSDDDLSNPSDTEWALGSTQDDDLDDLRFTNFNNFGLQDAGDVLPGRSGVLHLISDDVLLDITFLTWTRGDGQGNPGGGGFSYRRSSGFPVVEVGMNGDPHIKTWGGEWFDYMGECDLVLLHAPDFDGQGRDLSVHVRTTIRYAYSYIESAALKIGDDVLEVASFGDFAINGVDTPDLNDESNKGTTTLTLAGTYSIHHTQVDKKKHNLDVVLGPNQNITLSTFKDLVAVSIPAGIESAKYFGNSVGMMGSFTDGGTLLARDGGTVMEDMNAFGQEWQVNDKEPMLFRTARAPQYPSKCVLPTPKAATTTNQRRLGETRIARQAAEDACAHLLSSGAKYYENCVFDVMAIGDTDIAKDYPN